MRVQQRLQALHVTIFEFATLWARRGYDALRNLCAYVANSRAVRSGQKRVRILQHLLQRHLHVVVFFKKMRRKLARVCASC
jgi:hypothetical protein